MVDPKTRSSDIFHGCNLLIRLNFVNAVGQMSGLDCQGC
jgi:hypothetical protein